jgi:hypothetical protein
MAKRKIAPNAGSPKAAPTISQQELMMLGICQYELERWMDCVAKRKETIARKLASGAAVEPGSYQLVDGRVEVRA